MDQGSGVQDCCRSAALLLTVREAECALAEAVACQDRYSHRGGFSPAQLVFGENPRVPNILLTDDAVNEVGNADACVPSQDLDSAADTYRRKHEIRERARSLIMSLGARNRVREGLHSRHRSSKTFLPGQWVFVWRRPPRVKTVQWQRSRWTGPGAVVYQSGATVWVAMRSKLWKCSAEQVRHATRSEALGAEIVLMPEFEDLRASLAAPEGRVGATDTAEGPPPAEAHDGPGVVGEDPIEPLPPPPSPQRLTRPPPGIPMSQLGKRTETEPVAPKWLTAEEMPLARRVKKLRDQWESESRAGASSSAAASSSSAGGRPEAPPPPLSATGTDQDFEEAIQYLLRDEGQEDLYTCHEEVNRQDLVLAQELTSIASGWGRKGM